MKSLASNFLTLLTLFASGHAAAEVIYSGFQNLDIPTTYNGIPIDVDSNGTWDFNAYMGGVYVANNSMFQPARISAGDMGTLRNFAVDTTVGSGLLLGTGMGGSIDHLGTTFTAGQESYLGFKFNDTNYGWMRVVFTNNAGGAKVLDWAYDNSNGTAIATGNVLQSGSSVTLNSAIGSFTLGSQITGSNSVIKNGANSVTLTGTNNYSGSTAVSAGKLVIAGSIGNSAVAVSGAGTVLASGASSTIGHSMIVNSGAILAAGDATAGTATVTTSTTFNNGSIFSWDIDAAGTSYDKLVSASLMDGDAVGGSILRIVASDALVTQNFWNTTKTWTNIFTTDGSAAIADWASIFGNAVTVVNSSFNTITPVGGSFSVSNSTLTWTAVPEPSSALTGLLLGAGLLRRRRNVECCITNSAPPGSPSTACGLHRSGVPANNIHANRQVHRAKQLTRNTAAGAPWVASTRKVRRFVRAGASGRHSWLAP